MNVLGRECRQMVRNALGVFALPDSESAVRLLCMTAAHESGQYRYCRQIKGPALGLFQMEPATYKTVQNYIGSRQDRFKRLVDYRNQVPEAMIFDVELAAAIARIFYLMKPEPLPDPDDLSGLADYCKQYWNTHLGKATSDDYLQAYLRDYK